MTEVDADKVWTLGRQTKSAGANLKVWPPTDKNSAWYKIGVELGVIDPPDPPPPPPPPPPPLTGMYGAPWWANSLGNTPLRGSTRWEYGFDSLYDGDTDRDRIFLVFRAAGYTSGDGGKVKVELVTEAGGVLDSYTIDQPKSDQYHEVPLQARLVKGQRYRLRFTNPTGSSTNWVSCNDIHLGSDNPSAPPGSAAQRLVCYQDGSVNPRHVPVFTLTMADGRVQGGANYVDCPSRYDAASGQAEIVFTPKQARTFSKVNFRITGSPGMVTATLAGKTGTVQGKTSFWTELPLGVSLPAGQPQTLRLAWTGSQGRLEALQKGTPEGFNDPAPDGWRAVVSGRSDIDFPVYLA